MLLRHRLDQNRPRIGWMCFTFSILLASSGEGLCLMGVAAAATPGKGSNLIEMLHQMPEATVTPAAINFSASAIALPIVLSTKAQKTAPISQGLVRETNFANRAPDAKFAAQFGTEQQEISSDNVPDEQFPLADINDLDGFAHRGAADLLLDTGDNGEGGNSDRTPQAQQLKSDSQPTLAEDESDKPQTNGDPDLGILRLRQQELPPSAPPPKPPSPPPQPVPILHLLPRISYFQTNNIFSSVDAVGDGLIYPSLTLWAIPQIGRNTFLTPSIEGSLIRYIKQPEFNYNLLRFRTGISQRLSRQMFGEIGWTNQRFYLADVGDRFLNEHIVYLSLSRQDRLTQKLRLNSYYDLRVSFADPDSRSRIINSLYLSLSYSFQSNLLVALDYQIERSDFTVRDRYDQYHRIMGRLTYGVLRDSQISVSGGVSVGGSSEPFIDFDSLFFSVTYSVDFPIY